MSSKEKNIKSIFLGPKSENQDLFNKMCQIVLDDIHGYRRGFHPESNRLITEHDKSSESYIESTNNTIDVLEKIFGIQRRDSIPTFDQKYLAHMHGDLIFPAVIGYISSIMYNPNNVVGEASPATLPFELKFISKLNKMVGYPTYLYNHSDEESDFFSSGHLTSGGTTANIEGLWVARNLKYYPLTIKYLSENIEECYQLKVITVNGTDLKDSSYFDLFNLLPDDIYKLQFKINKTYKNEIEKNINEVFDSKFKEFSVQNLGIHDFHLLINNEISKNGPNEKHIRIPKLIISHTKHYSWPKSIELLGIGKKHIEEIGVDSQFKLDITLLEEKIRKLNNEGESILALIPLVGTTEEGIIDPIKEIIKMRDEFFSKYKYGFYLHADAAYGGYFASLLEINSINGTNSFSYLTKLKNTPEGYSIGNTDDDKIQLNILSKIRDLSILNDLMYLKNVDSITIDPHKLGYIPYPAGSVLYKNHLSSQHITFDAPYLKSGRTVDGDFAGLFMGNTTIEGSRPGAAATACHVAAEILPLDYRNHGRLLAYTMITTQKFFDKLQDFNRDDNSGIKLIPQFVPETNIVCYVPTMPNVIIDPKYLNFFVNNIFSRMSKSNKLRSSNYEYFVSKTDLPFDLYSNQIKTILKEALPDFNEFEKIDNKYKLGILRSVFMNPLSVELETSFYDKYFEQIIIHCKAALQDIVNDILRSKFNDTRIPIKWIENDPEIVKRKNFIETRTELGKFFSFEFEYLENKNREACILLGKNIAIDNELRIIILDVNLESSDHSNAIYDYSTAICDAILDNCTNTYIILHSEYFNDNNSEKKKVINHFKNLDNNRGRIRYVKKGSEKDESYSPEFELLKAITYFIQR
jgi:glutamate/tyrosine decarboxylase-like PLP-dependent enzyme